MVVMSVLSEPTVQSYIVYSGILALKMLGTAVLTATQRHTKLVYANPEDAAISEKAVVKLDDPDVERVRRAHLNDLENIPVFWVLGALYLTTDPQAEVVTNLFRIYAGCRILHTIVYAIKPLPQPTRAIAFGVPFLIKVYMGTKVVTHYISAL